MPVWLKKKKSLYVWKDLMLVLFLLQSGHDNREKDDSPQYHQRLEVTWYLFTHKGMIMVNDTISLIKKKYISGIVIIIENDYKANAIFPFT